MGARICPKCSQQTDEKICPDDGYRTLLEEHVSGQTEVTLVGTVFEERYRVDGLISHGGFGAVYRANQLAIDRTVAIKVLKPELCSNLKEVARFQQEARSIAVLKHPNIVDIHDFGSADNGSLYLVMEYLEGKTLSQMIRDEAPLAPERVVNIAIQMLDALTEAHGAGVVHRDLKPGNVIITEKSRRGEVAKLLDFGIAKLSGEGAANVTLTATGMAIGSPRYMAPEQCQGETIVPQTDLYSLGCILYELLSGAPVFTKENPISYLVAHVQEDPVPMSLEGRELQGPLADFIMSCLSKPIAGRPQSAETAMEAMKQMQQAPLGPPGPALAPDDPRLQSRTSTTMPLQVDGAGPNTTDTGLAPTGVGSTGQVVAETGSVSTSRVRSPLVWALVAAVSIAIGWLAAQELVTTPRGVQLEQPPPRPAAPAPPPPRAEEEPPPEPTPAPVVAAPDPVVLEPIVEPTLITVNLDSKPTGADVLQGGDRVGTTPMAISWEEGEAAPPLELRLRGHYKHKVALEEGDVGTGRIIRLRKIPPKAVTPKPAAKPEPKPSSRFRMMD